jgi:hypothetical protein
MIAHTFQMRDDTADTTPHEECAGLRKTITVSQASSVHNACKSGRHDGGGSRGGGGGGGGGGAASRAPVVKVELPLVPSASDPHSFTRHKWFKINRERRAELAHKARHGGVPLVPTVVVKICTEKVFTIILLHSMSTATLYLSLSKKPTRYATC